MPRQEQEHKQSLPEKALWWGTWGGLIIAMLGVSGGVVVTAGSLAMNELVYKRNEQTAS